MICKVGRVTNTSSRIDLASSLVAETSIHEASLREASPPFARLTRPIRVELFYKSCGCLLTRMNQVLFQGVYVGGAGGMTRSATPGSEWTADGVDSPASILFAGGE